MLHTNLNKIGPVVSEKNSFENSGSNLARLSDLWPRSSNGHDLLNAFSSQRAQ